MGDTSISNVSIGQPKSDVLKKAEYEQTRTNIIKDIKNHKLNYVEEIKFRGSIYAPAHYEYQPDRGETYGQFCKRYSDAVSIDTLGSKNKEIRKIQGDLTNHRMLNDVDFDIRTINGYTIPLIYHNK